jgi:hypothetical protein
MTKNVFRQLFSSIGLSTLLIASACQQEEITTTAQGTAASPQMLTALADTLLPPGCTNRGIKFDGVDDYIDLGNILEGTTYPITVSAWVQLDATATGTHPIFTSQDAVPPSPIPYKGYWFSVAPPSIFCEYGDGNGGNNPAYRRGRTANAGITGGTWRFVTAVLKGVSDVDLYVNGVNVGGTISGGSTQTMNNIDPSTAKIGKKYINTKDNFFKGIMDDVSVWSKALTVAEITQYMGQNPTGSEAGLQAYWNFDELSGTTVLDASANQFNGTLFNGAERVTYSPNTCYNGAILFDGTDDYIDLGNILDGTTYPITVSAWVRLDSTATGTHPIFTSQDAVPPSAIPYKGYWFSVAPPSIFCEYGDGNGGNNPAYRRGRTANAGITGGTWKFVTAVLKGVSDVELYVNGVNVGGTISGGSTQTMNNFDPSTAKIGKKYINTKNYFFKGTIDDVSVWSKALTVAEITQYMGQNPTGSETGLKAYWSFDELSGTTVIDKSSNNFTGTLVSSPVRVVSTAPNH